MDVSRVLLFIQYLSFVCRALIWCSVVVAASASNGSACTADSTTNANDIGDCAIVDSITQVEKLEGESSCKDDNDMCPQWASMGECEANPNFMLTNCQMSCNVCTGNINAELKFGVKQEVSGAEADNTAKVIRESIEYMRKVEVDPHLKSVRDLCRNQHELCSFWAAKGECDVNPGYLKVHCAPACQSCEMVDMSTRCPPDPDATDAMQPGDLNKMFERIESNFAEFEPIVHSRPNENVDNNSDGDNNEVGGPWVVTFEKFLTAEECDRLISFGRDKGFDRSEGMKGINADGTTQGEKSLVRTSHNTWCNATCLEDPIIRPVIDRIVDITGIPEGNSEDLQLLEYHEGQYYRLHHDYISHHADRRPGPRVLTFYLYLNDDVEGGETRFPSLGGLTVTPKRRRALLWPSVLDGDPNVKDPRTDHEALPVKSGVKYGANAWLHLREWKEALRLNCH